MKTLLIRWERLVTPDGETCERCSNTYIEICHAIAQLKTQLNPLGIQPILQTKTISEREFKTNPQGSNLIWINDKPLDEWLEATVGQSQCCAACGDANCRTLQIDTIVYESIPQALIIKAGLKAAQQMLNAPTPLSIN
ncbi:DUF2703 domain-containing protein [Tolumonas lignilytica]|jgi:Protein of unknown function (DUF2703).|uniref:DUF2703 domain-containing protein n=1 Tax=Tolumonas lignilytica TaxID=1283284 RepID=UPI000464BD6C|nr:DUF2703 domain-containing protein [Tolumonas lignilytica]